MFRRMKQGWELTKKSWSVVRANPGLVRLPIRGGIFAVLAMVIIVIPGVALLATEELAAQIGGGVLVAIGAYVASFSVIFYNVALAAAADVALGGGKPDLAAARAVARSKSGIIAKWALVSAIVSVVLSIIRDKGGFAGELVAGIGGAIWSLVTFMVVPVLVFEDVGPIDAMKRSASLFRARWGQQVTGNVAIGGVAGLITFVGILIGVGGVLLLLVGSAAAEITGGLLVLVGMLVAIGAAVFAGATRGVFGVALYRYIADDHALGPFTPGDLESAVKTS
ncbi:DUF6159 family protein [Ilumatobacter sp.]|uniref:DUF6159 family protein n=1 Tax=Ilumatobacter sp. TaxID=1967498 RepID=UPI003C51FED0